MNDYVRCVLSLVVVASVLVIVVVVVATSLVVLIRGLVVRFDLGF